MKNPKILGILGSLLLFISLFIPIAYLNSIPISMMPIFDNITIAGGVWSWIDIAFFSITMLIISIVSLYLTLTNKLIGLILTSIISFFVTLIMGASIFKLNDIIEGREGFIFQYGFGWITLILASLLLLIAGESYRRSTKLEGGK